MIAKNRLQFKAKNCKIIARKNKEKKAVASPTRNWRF